MDLIGPLRRKTSRLTPHTWSPTSLPSLPCKHTFELVLTCTDWNFEMKMKWKWISFLVSDKSASVMWGFCPPWLWNSNCAALLPFREYVYESFGFTTLLRTTNIVLCFIYQIFFIPALSPSASFWPPPFSSPFLFSTSLPPSAVGWACREPGWLGWWIICSTSLSHSLLFSLCLAHCLIMLSFRRYFLSLFLFCHGWTGEQTSKRTCLLDIFTFEKKKKKEAPGKIIRLPLETLLHLNSPRVPLNFHVLLLHTVHVVIWKEMKSNRQAENCNTTLRRRLVFTPVYMLDMAKNVWDEKTKHQKALALKKFCVYLIEHRDAWISDFHDFPLLAFWLQLIGCLFCSVCNSRSNPLAVSHDQPILKRKCVHFLQILLLLMMLQKFCCFLYYFFPLFLGPTDALPFLLSSPSLHIFFTFVYSLHHHQGLCTPRRARQSGSSVPLLHALLLNGGFRRAARCQTGRTERLRFSFLTTPGIV